MIPAVISLDPVHSAAFAGLVLFAGCGIRRAESRNRKPMNAGQPGLIAPWELRVGNLRVP
jgi:hypothetical protein